MSSNDHLTFVTNNTERMRLDNSGNLGIGTTSPSKKLVLNENDSECVMIIKSSDTGTAGIYLGDQSDEIVGGLIYDNANDLLQLRSSNNNIAVSINSSENVGIGTTSPDALLDVEGSSSLPLFLARKQSSAGVGVGLAFRQYDSTNALHNYGSIFGVIEDNTNGAEDGALTFHTSLASSLGERMRVTSSGNVGIGTTSPTQALHVVGNGLFTGGLTVGDSAADTFLTRGHTHLATSGNNVAIGHTSPEAKLDVDADSNQVAFMSRDQGSATYPAFGFSGQIDSNGNRGTGIFLASDGVLAFAAHSSERMRINSSGNVGIGTNTPATKLEVAGDITLPSNGQIKFKGTNHYPRIFASSNDLLINLDNGLGSNFTAFKIDNATGNIGIGTTSPAEKLDVEGNLRLESSSSNGTYLALRNSATNGRNFRIGSNFVTGAGELAVYDDTAGAERLRIDSSGNIGIGTTSPDSKLHIVDALGGGQLLVATSEADDAEKYGTFGTQHYDVDQEPVLAIAAQSSSSENNILIGGALGEFNAATSIKFFTAANATTTTGSERIRVTSVGNVGIGTTSPSGKLEISGNGLNEKQLVITDSDNTTGRGQFVHNGSTTSIISQGTSGLGTVIIGGSTVGAAPTYCTFNNTGVTVAGALSKGSGSFKINHPLKPDTHHLVHSFVEGPQADNLYRGVIELNNGKATIDLDEWFGMTAGTFLALNRDIQAFVNNSETWDAVRANVQGSQLIIECQNSESNAEVSWLVIGERQDKEIYDSILTDDNGKIIIEPKKT
jgi:hypothetical protein